MEAWGLCFQTLLACPAPSCRCPQAPGSLQVRGEWSPWAQAARLSPFLLAFCRLPYAGYFGGVSGLSKAQFLKINGFPNEYWGWGGEDDDIFNRISLSGMKVSRPDIRIGRYRMIKHDRDKHNEPNPQRFTKIQNTKLTMKRDGIGSVHYRVLEVSRQPLFTNITVDIGRAPPRPARG
uniref:Galactosyltransferase C-terminal domain-containing protein n=1 Tax=Sarcophilus harrisii TaxID=9305 RepID=A0A7N4UZA5_SARHA